LSAPQHKRAGVRLAVAEAGGGQPMLFQHGLCGDAAQPAEVFPFGQGWRCVTLECRGHGGSEAGPEEGFLLATFADDLASLIEARGLAPAVVGGISMGAALALRLAVTRKDLVRGLVVARPAWLDAGAPDNMRPNAFVGALLRAFPPVEARARFEASDVARGLEREAPDNLASLRGFFTRDPIAVTRELLCRISVDGAGVNADDIRGVEVPTLVIGHDRDAVHPLAIAQGLAALIPGARLVTITPKAESREHYRDDFRAALSVFLKEFGS
jgi:pimeloyl-ACP methyl ester carboxylesterase